MLIDSHCHLVSYRYQAEEINSIIERSVEQQVTQLLSLATEPSEYQAHLDLANNYSGVFIGLGIHPCAVHEVSYPHAITELDTLLAQHNSIKILGETGLDYYHPSPEGWDDNSYRKCQQNSLVEHFELAKKYHKNIVLHTRDQQGKHSLKDCLAIYQEYANDVQAVFHCWSHHADWAKQVWDLGGLISFGGVLTFKKPPLDAIEVCKQAPAGSFMLETDAPYLAPTPHRGQRCEPWMTRITAELVAELRHESLAQLASHTTKTAHQFLQL